MIDYIESAKRETGDTNVVTFLTTAIIAMAAVLLAASPLASGITGAYWSNCKISGANPVFMDTGLAKRLWDVSAQIAAMMTGRVNPPRQLG